MARLGSFSIICAALAVAFAAAPAPAQTPEVPADQVTRPPAPVVTHTARPVAKSAAHTPAKSAGKTKPKTPVVAPHHGTVVRQPVHPAAPLKQPHAKSVTPPVEPPMKLAPGTKPPPPHAKPAAPAKPQPPSNVGTVSGLPLPRYVTLKTDEVNMRAGPNTKFPIKWTYQRVGLPVKIEREFDVWRLVSDMDGEKGWVHQATLTGRRGFVIIGTEARELRVSASEDADPVAVLKPGVVGRLRACAANAAWCEVEVSGYRGWLRRDWFWGSEPNEAIQP